MSCLSRGRENNSAKTSTQVAPGTFTPASMPARSIIHMLSWLVTYKLDRRPCVFHYPGCDTRKKPKAPGERETNENEESRIIRCPVERDRLFVDRSHPYSTSTSVATTQPRTGDKHCAGTRTTAKTQQLWRPDDGDVRRDESFSPGSRSYVSCPPCFVRRSLSFVPACIIAVNIDTIPSVERD
jgi:hypothetical protein